MELIIELIVTHIALLAAGTAAFTGLWALCLAFDINRF